MNDDKIAELEDTIEKLKVCATCKWCDHDGVYYCSNPGEGAAMPWHWELVPTDPCYFTPSRWTPYWGEDGH